MHEFYFKDKNKNFAIRGLAPHNDVDCPPYDFFRSGHAVNASKYFEWFRRESVAKPHFSKGMRRFD